MNKILVITYLGDFRMSLDIDVITCVEDSGESGGGEKEGGDRVSTVIASTA